MKLWKNDKLGSDLTVEFKGNPQKYDIYAKHFEERKEQEVGPPVQFKHTGNTKKVVHDYIKDAKASQATGNTTDAHEFLSQTRQLLKMFGLLTVLLLIFVGISSAQDSTYYRSSPELIVSVGVVHEFVPQPEFGLGVRVKRTSLTAVFTLKHVKPGIRFDFTKNFRAEVKARIPYKNGDIALSGVQIIGSGVAPFGKTPLDLQFSVGIDINSLIIIPILGVKLNYYPGRHVNKSAKNVVSK